MKHALKSSASILSAPPIALSAVDVTPVEGATGNWIKLMPAGAFTGRTGRGPFLTGDQAGLESIIARTKKRAGATDLVVDYDHQTMFSAVPGVGGRAPAAGWIKELQARTDGIWGRVEWTEAAASAIRAGEYRYISPGFSAATPTGGNVGLLVSAGLTNIPDLDLAPIAASAFHPEETETDMKSIAKALGLPEEATEAEILAAMSALVTSKDALVAASGAAKPEEAVAAITAMRTKATAVVDPAQFVPIAQVIAMQADINALKATTASNSAEADVSKAIADGKIMPALKDWAVALHQSDVVAFNAFLEKSPVLTASQRVGSAAAAAVIEPVLDDSDLLVMSQLGLTKEQMLKSKKEAVA